MRARRLPVIDEYAHQGQAAVFVGDQVVVLSPVGTAVMVAVGVGWTPLTAISAHVEREVGAPPDGDIEGAVQDVLAELAGHRLVALE